MLGWVINSTQVNSAVSNTLFNAGPDRMFVQYVVYPSENKRQVSSAIGLSSCCAAADFDAALVGAGRRCRTSKRTSRTFATRPTSELTLQRFLVFIRVRPVILHFK